MTKETTNKSKILFLAGLIIGATVTAVALIGLGFIVGLIGLVF